MRMKPENRLTKEIRRQVSRMQQADRDRPTLLGQTVYLGTLGLLFVVPIVIGAYLGRWLDGFAEGYSVRWTISLIFLGVVIGAANVYLLVKE